MSKQLDPKELETQILVKAIKDPDFRKSLKGDARATIEKFLGIPLPEGQHIEVVEEAESYSYFVIPYLGQINTATMSEEEIRDLLVAGTCRNTGTFVG